MTNTFPAGQYLKLFITFFFTTPYSVKSVLHIAKLMSATFVSPIQTVLWVLMPQACVQRPRNWILKIIVYLAEHPIS